MVLPIIIRTTQEALKQFPLGYRTGALGIGATKWYMIRTIILPSAMPGIVTAVILSVGRIVGESAALLFTAGSAYLLPKNLFSHVLTSGGTLTIQMYLSMSKADYGNAFCYCSCTYSSSIGNKRIDKGSNKEIKLGVIV